jgi:hypothetical protein
MEIYWHPSRKICSLATGDSPSISSIRISLQIRVYTIKESKLDRCNMRIPNRRYKKYMFSIMQRSLEYNHSKELAYRGTSLGRE